MHQILHLIDFRCTFLQRNQDVNEDKEMVGKDQSTRNFEMFDQIMLDWIYLARVGMTVHKYLMVWSIHLMINHWFVSEWQWFLMLVYFIFSCNFHIAFVCNLLYGDICLSFIKKYYLQCALCKYNPGERPGNQFDKFQPNYSPQIPNNEKTNKQIPTTLLPFKFQTN